MLFFQDEPRRKARVEIIPMIDVMMFLLVFFVLISLNVIPAMGLKTELPGSGHAETLEVVRHVVVTISKEGRVQLDGKDIALGDLSLNLATQAKQAAKIDVVINGDKEVELERVIGVMDAVKDAGISNLSIAAKMKQ